MLKNSSYEKVSRKIKIELSFHENKKYSSKNNNDKKKSYGFISFIIGIIGLLVTLISLFIK